MVCVLFRTRLTKDASYFSSYILFILFINFRTDRDRFDPTLSKFDRTKFFAVVLHLNVSSGEIKVRQNTHVIALSGFSHVNVLPSCCVSSLILHDKNSDDDDYDPDDKNDDDGYDEDGTNYNDGTLLMF